MSYKMMVSEKVGDVYDRGFNGGDYSPFSNSQIGSELLPGQTDYSKEWAEYYRSLGMLKEAEIIEHGEGHWEASGGLPELAYFTVCGSAKWEFAAGEAIVRWWKCVLAKRRFAELRRF